MYSIITGTILVAFIHALIPNHWLPLVAIARSEKWEKYELMVVSTITACAHVLGTAILGVVLGLVGARLAHEYEDSVHVITPIVLIVFGLIYSSLSQTKHRHASIEDVRIKTRSKVRWIIVFAFMMFLSPCLEVESLFLAAGAYGWDNLLILILVYGLISVMGIVGLVMLTFKGSSLINSTWMEDNEKRITGVVLIMVGVVTFFLH